MLVLAISRGVRVKLCAIGKNNGSSGDVTILLYSGELSGIGQQLEYQTQLLSIFFAGRHSGVVSQASTGLNY